MRVTFCGGARFDVTSGPHTLVTDQPIEDGGPYMGLSSVMPAWQGTLSEAEIADVAAYVKSLCTDPNWLPGDLNFPRPLITGKAFPDQELIVGGRFARNRRDVAEFFGTADYRVDGLTNVEVKVRGLFIDPDTAPNQSGVGVQVPISHGNDFDYRPLFDIIYEYIPP